MKIETRGANTEVNEFMVKEVRRMLQAAADMYDVKLEISLAGSAPASIYDKELGEEIAALVKDKCDFSHILTYIDMGGSEDCTYFLDRVKKHGGKVAYMMYGTPIAAGHHNSRFDFDEEVLWKTAATITELAIKYSEK